MLELDVPKDVVDLARFLVETFYPQQGYDADKLISVAQFMMGRIMTRDEIETYLWTIYEEIEMTQYPTKTIKVKNEQESGVPD